jgi:hypothetical protein
MEPKQMDEVEIVNYDPRSPGVGSAQSSRGRVD